jgi:Ca-activated chloride channel family protein
MIHFASPLFLLLLPLPWFIWTWLPPSKKAFLCALPVPFFDFLQHHLVKSTSHAYPAPFSFFSLLWVLMTIALAGPQWTGEPIRLSQEGRNIFLVLDLSGSMELPDMVLNQRPATRLQVVKQAAEAFIKARPEDHLGLILFGSQAYLQTPLTYDHENILKRISDANVGLAGKTTSIGDALGLAVKKLQSTPRQGRIIILLTDGANNSGLLPPLKAAEIAHSEHIKIYTIGLSSEGNNQNLANLFISMQSGADLDEDTLKEIAQITGGQYFLATNPQSLNNIYQKIDKLETTEHASSPLKPKIPYYPWILMVCCGLLSLWIGRMSTPKRTST